MRRHRFNNGPFQGTGLPTDRFRTPPPRAAQAAVGQLVQLLRSTGWDWVNLLCSKFVCHNDATTNVVLWVFYIYIILYIYTHDHYVCVCLFI